MNGFVNFADLTGCPGRVAEPPGICGDEFEEARTILVPAR